MFSRRVNISLDEAVEQAILKAGENQVGIDQNDISARRDAENGIIELTFILGKPYKISKLQNYSVRLVGELLGTLGSEMENYTHKIVVNGIDFKRDTFPIRTYRITSNLPKPQPKRDVTAGSMPYQHERRPLAKPLQHY